MKKIYLIRHGQTYFNYYQKVQGRCDSPLTELGIQQAKQAGAWLKANYVHFDQAFCSTSERASDTLENIIGESMPYTRLKGLVEFSWGIFEGQDESLLVDQPYGDFYLPFGGDSDAARFQVMNETMQQLATEQSDESTSVVVSHGYVIKGFLQQFVQNGASVTRVPNCAIAELDFDGQNFKLVNLIDPNTAN